MAATANSHPLQHVGGVAESAMGDALAARLPDRSAPAPWTTRIQALVWFHRAAPGATELLPEPLRGERTIPLTIAAFIRYLDTPVGPYGEILASPVLLARTPPAAFVPFIAVDSLSSIHAGRANWALPKTLAAFEWSQTPERFGDGPLAVRGEGTHGPVAWSIAAQASPRRRRLPLRLPLLRDVQVTPDQRQLDVAMSLAGRAQLATVAVQSDGPTLPGWLPAGRHRGFVLSDARMTFGAPR